MSSFLFFGGGGAARYVVSSDTSAFYVASLKSQLTSNTFKAKVLYQKIETNKLVNLAFIVPSDETQILKHRSYTSYSLYTSQWKTNRDDNKITINVKYVQGQSFKSENRNEQASQFGLYCSLRRDSNP